MKQLLQIFFFFFATVAHSDPAKIFKAFDLCSRLHIQTMLLKNNLDIGSVDGLWGIKTSQALEKYAEQSDPQEILKKFVETANCGFFKRDVHLELIKNSKLYATLFSEIVPANKFQGNWTLDWNKTREGLKKLNLTEFEDGFFSKIISEDWRNVKVREIRLTNAWTVKDKDIECMIGLVTKLPGNKNLGSIAGIYCLDIPNDTFRLKMRAFLSKNSNKMVISSDTSVGELIQHYKKSQK